MKERRRYNFDNAETFFEFNDSIKDTLAEINRAELQSSVYGAFYRVMMPQYGTDPSECYEVRSYSYGLVGILDECVKRDFCETPAQRATLFRKMMKGQGEE